MGELNIAGQSGTEAWRVVDRRAAMLDAEPVAGVALFDAVARRPERAAVGRGRGLAVDGQCDHKAVEAEVLCQRSERVGCSRFADRRADLRVVSTLEALEVVAAAHDMTNHLASRLRPPAIGHGIRGARRELRR